MIVRNVFQAKYGRGDELVAILKEFRPALGRPYKQRILTDASGPFFTIVQEIEIDNIAEFESLLPAMFRDKSFQQMMAKSTPLIESGYREFWNVEQDQ